MQNGGYKTAGYNSVSPYLIVNNAEATIEFLRAVFDATELRRFANDKGGIVHAEVRIDDSVVMLADATAEYPPTVANVHVYVPDVDAAFQRAIAAGAVSLQEPAQREDEDKRGGVKDTSGTSWWIATRVGLR